MTIEDDAIGNDLFLGYALLNLAHAHGGRGEVENDMVAVSRWYAEGHGMGADNAFHAAMESRCAGTDADRTHGNHTFIGGHLHIVGETSAMAGMTKGDDTDAMFPGFSDRQGHRHVSSRLADVMIALDDGSNFAFAYYFGPLTKVDGPVFDPRQVGSHSSNAVAGVAAQIGPYE